MTKMKYLIVPIFIIGTIIHANSRPRIPRSSEFDKALNKYATVMYYINSLYVDTTNVPDLVDKAVVNTLANLDPHSTYSSKKDFDAANEPLQGNFNGIGIEFNILNDTLTIIAPISGGPSEKVGIIDGDRIISVDGEKIAGVQLTNEKAFSLLRGTKG